VLTIDGEDVVPSGVVGELPLLPQVRILTRSRVEATASAVTFVGVRPHHREARSTGVHLTELCLILRVVGRARARGALDGATSEKLATNLVAAVAVRLNADEVVPFVPWKVGRNRGRSAVARFEVSRWAEEEALVGEDGPLVADPWQTSVLGQAVGEVASAQSALVGVIVRCSSATTPDAVTQLTRLLSANNTAQQQQTNKE